MLVRFSRGVAWAEAGREWATLACVGSEQGGHGCREGSGRVSWGMSGAWHGRRRETDGRPHGSGPRDVTDGRVGTSSGVSGAGDCEYQRNPMAKRDSVGLPDAHHCRRLEVDNPVLDSGGDPELASSQSRWCDCAGMRACMHECVCE